MDNKKAQWIKKSAEADAARILMQAEQKGQQIIEEAQKKANAETGKALKDAEHKGRQIIEEAQKKANAESINTIKATEQKGRQIIEEARKNAEAETNKMLKDAEQKGHQIIEEAKKNAEAETNKMLKDAEQKGHQIIEEAKKKAESKHMSLKAAGDTGHQGSQIIEEARKQAEAEGSKIIAEAQQKARQITEEAKKKHGKVTPDKVIVDAEQRARQIIEEAERIAAASSPQRQAFIMKAVREKAGPETKIQQQEATTHNRFELYVIPPVDFSQLNKLRLSLQQIPSVRVLSTEGSPYGGTKISLTMGRPGPLAGAVRELDVVEEAVEDEALDSHPLGDFLKKSLPKRHSKGNDEQRILVVLKRA